MKAILMSIKPQWCEKIFNGSKSIEVRKSVPNLETPFTVYVYQTKIKFKVKNWQENFQSIVFTPNGGVEEGNGKVIGSFVCDSTTRYNCDKDYDEYFVAGYIGAYMPFKEMCLTNKNLIEYGKGDALYGWHITEPKLFDKPRDITEFALYGKCADECSEYDFCARDDEDDRMRDNCFKRTFLKRPPQSYCFVETDEK